MPAGSRVAASVAAVTLTMSGLAAAAPWGTASPRRQGRGAPGALMPASARPIVVEPGPISLVDGLAANLLPPDGKVVSTKVLRARDTRRAPANEVSPGAR